MTTLRTLAWLLFLPHFAFTVYLSTNPQWGLLDADLIGGINFGLWLLFAYTHHASVAATKWEVPTMFALQAIVLWVTVYIDSVLKMELFFGNHTYHEKTQYAGWIGGVPVYAVLAMFPVSSTSTSAPFFAFSNIYSIFLTHLFSHFDASRGLHTDVLRLARNHRSPLPPYKKLPLLDALVPPHPR